MRRRSGVGGAPVKARRRKTAARKRGNALKVRGRGSSARGKETELARLTRERNEALEQLSEALKQRPATVTSLGRLVATKQLDHVADMRQRKRLARAP
jgi:hypothetical protein